MSLNRNYSSSMKIICLLLSVLALTLISACGGGGGGGGSSSNNGGSISTGGGTPEREAIDRYLNQFILPTLTSLDNSAGTLLAAVQALAASTTEANLASARAAWVASRVPWEQSESALFGPVDFFGFDPALDTWPVNQTDLLAVLNGSSALNTQTVANLDNALKGYHTIEYLLYGERAQKTAAQFTAREFEYLLATTAALKDVTSQLLAAWVSGIQGQRAYAQEVALSGQGSTVFPTEQSALEQFARGIVTICDEVANGKIADPFDQRNPNIVESQFSGNSLTDFANNILGAKFAYESALAALVTAEDPALNAEIIGSFNAAVAAIQNIPEPFLTAIQSSSNDSTIQAAQNAIRRVQTLIEGQVIPIILS